MILNSVDIDLYIEYGRIAQFVISDYVSEKAFFGNSYYNPDQAKHIFCATHALINAKVNGSGSASLQSLAQYQYSLYSGFIGQIQAVIDALKPKPLLALLINDDPLYLDTGFTQPLLYR